MVEAAQVTLSKRDLVNASKSMSYVLRHGAQKEGIHMRQDGFIYLADLLNYNGLKKLGAGERDVEHIVATSDKKRFEMREEEGVKLIRAAQGHSLEIVQTEELLT